MKWHISFNDVDDILTVKTSGILNPASSDELRRESFALMHRHDCHRLLIDHRDIVTNLLTTLDIYKMPREYDALGISRKFRLAVVVRNHLLENAKFYETVCRNTGYTASVFLDPETAIAWLTA